MDILLVDDIEDYLTLVKEVLDQNGYTVHIAHDGVEGCEVLATTDIDLIISDIGVSELASVLSRRVREGRTTTHDARIIYARLLADIELGVFTCLAPGHADFRRADELLLPPSGATPHGPPDALHLALAITAKVVTFMTGDKQLASAARAQRKFSVLELSEASSPPPPK